MIIVQTPLRVSFFGGGTDFATYYRAGGGCVLTTAIDKYIYVTIKRRFDDMLRIGYTRTEMVETVDEIQHELIREALRKAGIHKGVEITTMGDIPAGSGLGSSSAVTVGSLHAMYAHRNQLVTNEQLAREACEIEIQTLSKPIGKQDQYIAAYGGLRQIEFCSDGSVVIETIDLEFDLRQRFSESFLLFFTGKTRSADSILREQKERIKGTTGVLGELKAMAYEARGELQQGNLDRFGRLMDTAWCLKRQLASQISNDMIESIYHRACAAGALGGKITGAGGGGFLLLFCPPERRNAVRSALSELRELPFQLEPYGSKVIFDHPH